MPMKRYKPEQIIALLRQIEVEIANGKTIPQACKEAEITVHTGRLPPRPVAPGE
jgi:putative transposase